RRNQTDRPGGPGRSGGGWGTSRAGRVPGRERGDAGSPRQAESSPDPLNDTTKSRWRDLAAALDLATPGAGRDLPILDERLEPLEVALHAALDQAERVARGLDRTLGLH